MSALEREIVEKFLQLNPAARQRVRTLIEQETTPDAQPFDYDTWFKRMASIRQKIDANPNMANKSFDVTSALRDLRDGLDE